MGGSRRRAFQSGEHLVMDELSRRGFEAQLSDRKEHVLLVRAGELSAEARSSENRALDAMVRAPCEF